MNLLTFLGAGKYSETTYTLDEQQHTTRYAPAAAAHFFHPKKTLVAVTALAKEKHFEALADEIADVTEPVAVHIPDGKSEDELWQMFNALTEKVAEGDELVVDITYGFRSLPFLSFLAIAFLRLARNVKVRRVVYGAWDARTGDLPTDISPVFDLTPFVTLLDWTIATDRFNRFGDAADLASLLREEMPSGKLMSTDMQARSLGNALRSTANAMKTVSSALRLTRPIETMMAANTMQRQLAQASPIIAKNIPPFSLLAEQMQQTYQPLSLDEPLSKKYWQSNIKVQLNLIGRYLEQGQIVQAMTLAREWLVSLLVVQFNAGELTDYEAARKPVEDAINNHAARLRGSVPWYSTPFDEVFQTLPNADELGKLWDKLAQIRNDIAHVGMNFHPKPAEKLREQAEAIYPQLQAIWSHVYPELPQ